jgi:hypothetical protein
VWTEASFLYRNQSWATFFQLEHRLGLGQSLLDVGYADIQQADFLNSGSNNHDGGGSFCYFFCV